MIINYFIVSSIAVFACIIGLIASALSFYQNEFGICHNGTNNIIAMLLAILLPGTGISYLYVGNYVMALLQLFIGGVGCIATIIITGVCYVVICSNNLNAYHDILVIHNIVCIFYTCIYILAPFVLFWIISIFDIAINYCSF